MPLPLFELRSWAFLKSVVGNVDFCIVLLTDLLSEFLMAEMIEVFSPR